MRGTFAQYHYFGRKIRVLHFASQHLLHDKMQGSREAVGRVVYKILRLKVMKYRNLLSDLLLSPKFGESVFKAFRTRRAEN